MKRAARLFVWTGILYLGGALYNLGTEGFTMGTVVAGIGVGAMLIAAFSYWLVERIVKVPLFSTRAVLGHFVFINAGLGSLVLFPMSQPAGFFSMVAVAAGTYLFLYNLWMTCASRPHPVDKVS